VAGEQRLTAISKKYLIEKIKGNSGARCATFDEPLFPSSCFFKSKQIITTDSATISRHTKRKGASQK